MLIRGACHCGNISFVLDWMPDPTRIPARACTCSFCTRHNGVWTSCPTGSLEVAFRDAALVSPYSFGTGTAEFHVCARCGVVPLVTSRIDGRIYAVVNVNTFDGVEGSLFDRTPSIMEGETEQARLARRVRNWIGKVEFVRPVLP